MNKHIALPLLIAAFILQGCGDSTATSPKSDNSLTTFLSFHDKYCAAEYTSAEQLTSALEKDPEFSVSKIFDGIYESNTTDISYAISPEESGCTTDFKIRPSSTAQPYFAFEDINTALLSKGYKPKGEKVERTEIGLDSNELKVIEQKYEFKDNTISTLVFPLENEDQYYMTLFVEKFEIQGASLKVSAPGLVEI